MSSTISTQDISHLCTQYPTEPEQNASPISTSPLQKGNADMILTFGRSVAYCGIDGVGGLRQTGAAIQAASLIFHASPVVSNFAGVATPIGLLATGPACMLTAAIWTLPDAWDALQTASTELDLAKESDAQQEAVHAAEIAKLGFANHSLYFSMGAAQSAAGIVEMCGPTMAHIFHYAPVLTGASASIASMVSGAALGAVYAARGGVMMTRAAKSYCLVNDFHKEFKEQFEGKFDFSKKIDKAFEFMKEAESQGKDLDYLKRRVDLSCFAKTSTKDVVSSGDKLEYLKGVDKGIFTEKLKHQISMVIAAAMILGGVLAIVLAIVTGGIGPIIVALLAAIFFMSMEYIFMAYDSSYIFESLRDFLYETPEWLENKIDKKIELDPILPPIHSAEASALFGNGLLEWARLFNCA